MKQEKWGMNESLKKETVNNDQIMLIQRPAAALMMVTMNLCETTL